MKFTPQAAALVTCFLLMCITTIPGGEAKRRVSGGSSRGSSSSTYGASGCDSGYYHDDTLGTCWSCPSHCLGPCTDGSGECAHGCEAGFYGDKCTKFCSSVTCECCDQTTGDCLLCDDGYYGHNCGQFCPVECPVFHGTKTCDRLTGACRNQSSSTLAEQCPTYSYSGSGGLGRSLGVPLVILLVTLARWLLPTRA